MSGNGIDRQVRLKPAVVANVVPGDPILCGGGEQPLAISRWAWTRCTGTTAPQEQRHRLKNMLRCSLP